MNNSPGWASPGSGPSDSSGSSGPSGPADPADQGEQTVPEAGAEQPAPQDAVPSTWSKNQPPAAGWSTSGTGPRASSGPGGPVPPPPPGPGPRWGAHAGSAQGWGTASGRGTYWHQLPPAPKPGVIPLRPLSVAEILEGSIATMRAHSRTVLGISLGLAVVTETVSTLVTGFFFNSNPSLDKLRDGTTTKVSDVLKAFGDSVAGSGSASLISMLGQIIATAMLTMIVSRSVLGRSVTAGEAWRDSRPRLVRMLGLTLLIPLIGLAIVGLGVMPGVLLALFGSANAGAGLAFLGGTAGGCVAIWLTISLSLSSPALMLEKQGVFASIARSYKLVRGSWWRVFGVQLLAILMAFIITSIVSIPFTVIAQIVSSDNTGGLLAGAGSHIGWAFLIVIGVGAVVGTMFTFPLSAGMAALLYMDQRIRREGLDIELARAAGVDGYAASPSRE
ncbi:glycerophosphoryl diester phosphodiesterase membrane domain-containing protein [Streptantibioticus ferralitis]|uniref:Glycerophosphoryl diester phosphodiesterase membrane domain-containing protein n=1 Tax=Streptantibioticus ferralitis TaxID=236510 RepID=A0ABT5YV16_9ACTN|nr:hypothetical protein [Streptantibioticus ferralitis]